MLFALFIYIFWKAQRNNKLDWVDVITKDGRIVSLTKILQLIGGVIGTWIVVQLTLDKNLTWEIFLIFLAYVASIEGFSKFVQAKYGPYGDGNRQAPTNSLDFGNTYGREGYASPPVRTTPVAKPAEINLNDQAADLQTRQLSGGARAQLDEL